VTSLASVIVITAESLSFRNGRQYLFRNHPQYTMKYTMRSLMFSSKISLSHIACVAVLASALPSFAVGADFSYSNDFSEYGVNPKTITSTASSANGFFSKDPELGTWELINGRVKAVWTGSSEGVSSFVKRDFREDNLLGVEQSIENPSLTIAAYWTNGNSADAFLWSYFGLLNASGQGYIAAVSRSGIIEFFEVDSLSDASSWTLLGSNDTGFMQGQTTHHSFTFSIQSNDLTLVNTNLSKSTDASFSVALPSLKYSEFTTIVFGGKFGTGSSGSSFNVNFDDLLVTGTSIPEPGSVALLSGGVALAACALFRRKF